jgi:hypothetical protein
VELPPNARYLTSLVFGIVPGSTKLFLGLRGCRSSIDDNDDVDDCNNNNVFQGSSTKKREAAMVTSNKVERKSFP